jgi:two-component SAPR family response regulator
MMSQMDGLGIDAYTHPPPELSNSKPNEFGLLIFDIRMPEMTVIDYSKKFRIIDSNIDDCFMTALEDYHEE